MKAFVYLLVALYFVTISAEDNTWTGEGGSGNNTASNPLNWSTGQVPTATSVVYLNDTSCTGTCTIVWDIDSTISGLHCNGTSSGVYIQIIGGKKLTVTGVLSIGNPWTESNIRIEIIEGSSFEIAEGAEAWIYSTSYGTPIYGNDDKDNWFINKGTVTVIGNDFSTTADDCNIGSGSGVILNVDSWGTWDVTDGKIILNFYYLKAFNIYGGSFVGTWITDKTVSIQVYGCKDTILQDGAGGDATGLGKVTFQYVNFGSSNSQSGTYSDPAPNTFTFNTTGVTVSESQFDSYINILFLFDGYLENCNITGYAMVNSSSTVSGVHAYFIGDNNNVQDAIFAGIGTDFIIQVQETAVVTMTASFALYGSVKLVIVGTWVYDSSSSLFWDAKAYWINLGLLSVINKANDWIQKSTFPSISPPAPNVGTLVNYGTIEFSAGGGLYFYDGTGSFRQGKNGFMKFEYGDSDSGSVQFAEVILEGWIGVYFSDDYTFSTSGNSLFFSWKKPASALPFGDINYIATGPGILGDIDQYICFDTSSTTGGVNVYKIKDLGLPPICPSGEYHDLLPFVTGDATSDLPDTVKIFEDQAVCTADKGCGSIATGNPSGGSGTPAAGNVNVASLAFIVSLICLLFKF